MPLELEIEEPVVGGGVIPNSYQSNGYTFEPAEAGHGNGGMTSGVGTEVVGSMETPRVDYSDRLKHDNLLDQCSEMLSLIRGKVMEDPDEDELIAVNNRSSKFRTQSTVGLMLHGCTVEGMVVGGPAHHCKELERGDYIASIDDAAVDIDSVLPALIGSDQPGSKVSLTVQKGGPGGVSRRVVLQRMPSTVIAERLKFYDLFTEIKQRSEDRNDNEVSGLVDQAMSIWTKATIDQGERQSLAAEAQSRMRDKCMRWLRDLDGNIDELRSMQSMHLRRRDDAEQRMNEVVRELEVSRNMTEKLRQELVKARVERQDGLAREKQYLEEAEHAKARAREREERCVEAEGRVKDLDNDKAELSAQIVALHAELRKAYKSLDDDTEVLKESLQAAESRLVAAQTTSADQKVEIASLQLQMEELRAKAREAELHKAEADAQCALAKEEVGKVEASLARARRECDASFLTITDCGKQRESLEREVGSLKRSLAGRSADLDELRGECAQEKERHASAVERLATCQETEMKMRKRLGELERQVEELREREVKVSGDASKRAAELQEEARRASNDAKDLRAKLERVTAELEAEKASVLALTDKLSKAEVAKMDLGEAARKAESDAKEARAKLERVTAELEAEKASVLALTDKLSKAEVAKMDLGEAARKAESDAKEARAKLERVTAELEAERASIVVLTRKLSKCEAANHGLMEEARELGEARGKLERANAEFEAEKASVLALTGKLSKAEVAKMDLGEAARKAESDAKEARAKLERVTAELEAERKTVIGLTSRVSEAELLTPRLEGDVRDAAKREVACKEALERMRAEHDKAVSQWRHEKGESGKEILELRGRVHALEQRSEALEESNSALRVDVEAKAGGKDKAEAAQRVAMSEAKALTDKVARLREEVSEKDEEISRVRHECETLAARVESLMGELGGEQGALKRVLEDAVHSETTRRELEREVAALRGKLASTEETKAEAEEAREAADDARERAEQRCNRLSSDGARLRDDAERLGKMLGDAQARASEWEGRAGGLGKRIEELERQVCALGGDLSMSRGAARDEAQRAAARESEISVLKAETQSLKKQMAEAASRSAELESAANEAVSLEGKLRGRIGELEAEVGGMKTRGDGGVGEAERERDAALAALGRVYAACCPGEENVRGKGVAGMADGASEAAHAKVREVEALKMRVSSMESVLGQMEDVRGEARKQGERARLLDERLKMMEGEAVGRETRLKEATMGLEVRGVELEGEKRLRVRAERELGQREEGWRGERARLQSEIDKERAGRQAAFEAGSKEARGCLLKVRDAVCREGCIAGALGVTLRRCTKHESNQGADSDSYLLHTISPGGPAEEGGKMALGDIVVSVGGVPLAGKSAKEVMRLCAGEGGSAVEVCGRSKEGGGGYTVVLVRQGRQGESAKEVCDEACASAQRLYDEVSALRTKMTELSKLTERGRMAEASAEEDRARLKKANAKAGDVERELARVREQVDTLNVEGRNLRRHQKEASEAAAMSYQRAVKAERELGQALAQVAVARREAEALKDRACGLQGALDAERGGNAEARAEIGALGRQVEAAVGEKRGLEDAVDRLKEEVVSLKDGLPKLEATIRVLQGEMDHAAAALKFQVSGAEKEVRIACERVRGGTVHEAPSDGGSSTAEISGLKGRLEGEARRAKAHEAAIERLRAEVDALRAREAALEKMVKDGKQEMEALTLREREVRCMLAKAKGQAGGATEAAGMLEGQMRLVHTALIKGSRASAVEGGGGEVGITLACSGGRILVKDVIANGAAEGCGKIFPGDSLVSVASRDVRGLSVRDVQRLFAGDPGMPVHVEGYRAGAGMYSVTLVRSGGGVTPSDMCDEAVAAAHRLHEEMGLLRVRVAEGRGREGELEARVEEVKEAAKDAERRAADGARERERCEALLKEALERIAVMGRDAVKAGEALLTERGRVREGEDEVARAREEVKGMRCEVERMGREVEELKRAVTVAKDAGSADKRARDDAVVGQRDAEGKVEGLQRKIKELEGVVREQAEMAEKGWEECKRVEEHCRKLKDELDASGEDKRRMHGSMGESDRRAKELEVALRKAEKALSNAEAIKERELEKEGARWETIVCELERRVASLEADVAIKEAARSDSVAKARASEEGRVRADEALKRSEAAVRKQENELEQFRRMLGESQLDVSDARGALREMERAMAEEKKAAKAREEGMAKEAKGLQERIKGVSQEGDKLRGRVAALERDCEAVKALASQAKEKEKTGVEKLSQCKAQLDAAMAEILALSKVGVGMLVTEKPPHRVGRIVDGGGAQLAGKIQVGDLIVTVDGLDCGKMSIAELKARLQGKQNTEVKVGLMRGGGKAGGDAEEFEVAMMRGVPGQGSDFLHRPASKSWLDSIIKEGQAAFAGSTAPGNSGKE